MTRVALFLLVALLSAPLAAVDFIGYEIDTAANTITFFKVKGAPRVYDYTSLQPFSAATLESARIFLQVEIFDEIINRNQLPSDDPDRLADPANECAQWKDGPPGPDVIHYRSTVVRSVTADANDDPVVSTWVCDFDNPPVDIIDN